MTYTMGRDVDCDFVVNSMAVSRSQLRIMVQDIQKSEVTNLDAITPFQIHVLSRARSVINGQLFKLGKSDTEHLVLEYTTDENINIGFKNVENVENFSPATCIYWQPFNVALSTLSPSELYTVKELFAQTSVDCRLLEDVEHATHVYSTTGEMTWNLRHALALGKLIVGPQWLERVLADGAKVSTWLLANGHASMCPNGCLEFLPNKKRSDLLAGVKVVIMVDQGVEAETIKCHAQSWIKALGGEPVTVKLSCDCNQALIYQNCGTILESLGKCLIFVDILLKESFASTEIISICKDNGCEPINLDILDECVLKCSIEWLQRFVTRIEKPGRELKLRQAYEILSSKNTHVSASLLPKTDGAFGDSHFEDENSGAATQNPNGNSHTLFTTGDGVCDKDLNQITNVSKRENPPCFAFPKRKRQRYRKVDKMHFFDLNLEPKDDTLSSSQNVPTTSIVVLQNATLTSMEITKTNLPQTHGEDMETVSLNVNQEIPKLNTRSIALFTDDMGIGFKRMLEKDAPTTTKCVKSSISLVNATNKTGDESTRTANETLCLQGNESNFASDNFSHFAIVENVYLSRSRRANSPSSLGEIELANDYSGRRDFKNFKKKWALQPSVTRSFVEMNTVSVNNEISFASYTDTLHIIGHEKSEKKMAIDFARLMGDVRPSNPGESLFVSDSDDEPNMLDMPESRNVSTSRMLIGRSGQANESVMVNSPYMDEDDEYTQPRFKF